MTNSASFIKRPTEFHAMQWDNMESAINMMDWLKEQGMMEIQIVQRPIYTNDKPYIEYRDPDKLQKVFLEQYVVTNTATGSTKVLWPRDFERLFMERPMTVAEANERFLKNSLNLVGEQRIIGLEIHRFSEDVQPVGWDDAKAEPEEDCCGRDSESEPAVDETVNLESDEMAESRDFRRDVASLLNKWSAETVSGTPDFILAEFFETVLGAWNEATIKRAKWRGESVQLPSLQKMQMNSEYGKAVYEVDKDAEQPFTQLEPLMLQGLCLIKGKLYGIRESDGSYEEITFDFSKTQ